MGGINPGNFKGEFKEAPVAVKFLLKKSGEHLDLAEERLRAEGWLRPDESRVIQFIGTWEMTPASLSAVSRLM